MFCELDNCDKVVGSPKLSQDCHKIVCEFGPRHTVVVDTAS